MDESLANVLEKADTTGSTTLNYADFLAATVSTMTVIKKEALQLAFKTIDKDKTGTINIGNLRDLLNS